MAEIPAAGIDAGRADRARTDPVDSIRRIVFAVAQQGLAVREYVKLKKLDEAINGLPISKEWRCFCYKLLCHGFYWSNFPDVDPGPLPKEGIDFVSKITSIVSQKTNFYVVDVAEKENGEYMVVELNDGQQSGTSSVDVETLYSELKKAL